MFIIFLKYMEFYFMKEIRKEKSSFYDDSKHVAFILGQSEKSVKYSSILEYLIP